MPIVNDNVDEPSETVNLALSNPTGGATLGTPITAVLTIGDEDVPGAIGFSAGTYTVLESAGLALITVTRTGAAGAVTVDFTTADGSAIAPVDYTAVSRTLSFGGGETTKTIAIPILEDGIREGNETILLVLSNPTGGATLGATSQAILTITDNEAGAIVQFSSAAYSVAENALSGTAAITITRTGSTAAGDTVLFKTLTGGTAVLGIDYTGVSNQPVTFAAGQVSTTVHVPIINNTNIVGSRTVNMAITSPSVGLSLGSPRTAVLTILEDDATLQFASATASVTEGSSAVLAVTRTGGTVSPATVAYTTANGTATAGSDYTGEERHPDVRRGGVHPEHHDRDAQRYGGGGPRDVHGDALVARRRHARGHHRGDGHHQRQRRVRDAAVRQRRLRGDRGRVRLAGRDADRRQRRHRHRPVSDDRRRRAAAIRRPATASTTRRRPSAC